MHVFGFRFLLSIVGVQWLLKGLSMSFSSQANPYLYRSLGSVSAPEMQIYTSIIGIPWALKPVMGVLSDFVPLFGYHKLSYMIPFNIVAIVCSIFIVFLWPLTAPGMTLCAFLVMYNTAQCDLLVEARYSTKIKERASHGPALISFVTAGTLTPSNVKNSFSDHTL
jgi:hypothetical protein